MILTLDTFNAKEETAHLLSTSANTKRLMESIAQDKAGKVTVRALSLSDTKSKREPFKGTGKPEPLKGNLAGYLVTAN